MNFDNTFLKHIVIVNLNTIANNNIKYVLKFCKQFTLTLKTSLLMILLIDTVIISF